MEKGSEVKFSVHYDEKGQVVGVTNADGKEVQSEPNPGESGHLKDLVEKGFSTYDVISTPILRFYQNPICCVIVGNNRIYYPC